MNNKRLYANIAILLTILFWGVSASSNKIVLREVPPATLALIRFIIASVVLFILNIRMNPEVKLQRADVKKMILGGTIGVTVYFIFENYGLRFISAANATILLASIPLFTVVIEGIVFKKKIGTKKMLGVILSLLGVILVIGNSISVDKGPDVIIGTLLMLGAALSWVIYSLINKSLDGSYPTIFLSTYQSIIGGLFLIPFALLERKEWQPISLISWVNILYLALFCSALCYILYLYALKHLGPSQTNVYINLMPFIGVIAAFLILGERLYSLQLLGGLIIILGIFVVNHRGAKQLQEAEA